MSEWWNGYLTGMICMILGRIIVDAFMGWRAEVHRRLAVQVLAYIRKHPGCRAFEIMDGTGVKVLATLYILLIRLEREGKVWSAWVENEDPAAEYPRRRIYFAE